jgi:hypothetical protein
VLYYLLHVLFILYIYVIRVSLSVHIYIVVFLLLQVSLWVHVYVPRADNTDEYILLCNKMHLWHRSLVFWSSTLSWYIISFIDSIAPPLKTNSSYGTMIGWFNYTSISFFLKIILTMIWTNCCHKSSSYNESVWCFYFKLNVCFPFSKCDFFFLRSEKNFVPIFISRNHSSFSISISNQFLSYWHILLKISTTPKLSLLKCKEPGGVLVTS